MYSFRLEFYFFFYFQFIYFLDLNLRTVQRRVELDFIFVIFLVLLPENL